MVRLLRSRIQLAGMQLIPDGLIEPSDYADTNVSALADVVRKWASTVVV